MIILDRRQVPKRVNEIKYIFKKVSKNTEIISSNSSRYPKNMLGQLQGGIIRMILGNVAGIIKVESIQKVKKRISECIYYRRRK